MPSKSSVVWTIEALNDFEYYIDWYLHNASVEVAENFTNAIEYSIITIAENNYIAKSVDEIPELREYVVQKFPYLISYWIKNNSEIIITSFLHQKRKL